MTILVVGNSSGIGAAVAKALVERGDIVTGISRNPSSLSSPMQGRFRHEVMDVTSSPTQRPEGGRGRNLGHRRRAGRAAVVVVRSLA